VIDKQNNIPANVIERKLQSYLPKLKIESDLVGGDVVFRTNQQPDDQFVQALRSLESMKNKEEIKAFGVQNSTMDDVFLKITKDIKNTDETGTTYANSNQLG
jgi:hypothetical protein